MAFLNCPACHLSIPVEHAQLEHCPRCRKRDGELVPMFRSPLPYRLLTGSIFQERRRDSAA
jgi:hypothetical protein